MVELLVVIAIIGILAALLLPALSGGKARAKRVLCESQLQEIGLAFHGFAHDHNSRFPWQVAIGDGGSREYVQSGNLTNGDLNLGYRHFQPLAGLLTPKLLVCPSDTRLPATNFASLQNTNVSYFVGVTAIYDQPMSILAGDGNLATSTSIVRGGAGGRLTWNRDLHQFKGNVLFADGHVEEWSDNGTLRLGSSSTLVLPTVTTPGKSGPQASTAGGAGTTTQPAGGAGEPTPTETTNREAAAHDSPASHPPIATRDMPAPKMVNSSRGAYTAASGQNEIVVSNGPVENAPAATNTAGAKGSGPGDDATMSPFDRKLAKVLREILVGTYFLILLLVLLFAAYRIWRWQQNPGRRRRK